MEDRILDMYLFAACWCLRERISFSFRRSSTSDGENYSWCLDASGYFQIYDEEIEPGFFVMWYYDKNPQWVFATVSDVGELFSSIVKTIKDKQNASEIQ